MKSYIKKIVMCAVMILVSAGTIYSQKIKMPRYHIKQKTFYITTVTQNGLLDKMTQLIDSTKKAMPNYCWNYMEWGSLTIEYTEKVFTKIYVDETGITHHEGLIRVSSDDMRHLFNGEPVSRDITITCGLKIEPLGHYVLRYKNYNYLLGSEESEVIKNTFRFVKKTLRYKELDNHLTYADNPFMEILYKSSGEMVTLPIVIEKSPIY